MSSLSLKSYCKYVCDVLLSFSFSLDNIQASKKIIVSNENSKGIVYIPSVNTYWLL